MGEEGRVFLRGMSSDQYGLDELRRRQRAAPRVRVYLEDAPATGREVVGTARV